MITSSFYCCPWWDNVREKPKNCFWSAFFTKTCFCFHSSVKSTFRIFFSSWLLAFLFFLECPPDWSLLGESCYKVHTSPNTWDVTAEKCLDLNSNFVDITSSEENVFVASLVATANFDRAWIGLSDRQQENRFIWTDGSYSDFENWGTIEPNGNTSENCVFIDSNSFEWADVGCNNSYRSICENSG